MEVFCSVKVFDIKYSPDLYVFRSPESKRMVLENWFVRMYMCDFMGNIQLYISRKLIKTETPTLIHCTNSIDNIFRIWWISKNRKWGKASWNWVFQKRLKRFSLNLICKYLFTCFLYCVTHLLTEKFTEVQIWLLNFIFQKFYLLDVFPDAIVVFCKKKV